MPGVASVIFSAAAGAAGTAKSAQASPSPAAAVVKRFNMAILPLASSVLMSAFENEFGFARLPHQRRPHPLAQFGKARLAQRRARARLRQVDGDGLVDARGPALEHDDAMAEQHRLFDRVRDEDHRGRPLLPD